MGIVQVRKRTAICLYMPVRMISNLERASDSVKPWFDIKISYRLVNCLKSLFYAKRTSLKLSYIVWII